MASQLDEARLSEELSRLPGWSGDTSRINRTVHPGDRRAALLEAVARAADELDHHPVVHEEPGGAVRFEVWTHSAGGVTELDVRLAARIDELVREYEPGR